MCRLRPSSADRHGILPNEIHKQILSHVDGPTRIACGHVSRAFSDLATYIFTTEDGLRAESNGDKTPEFTNLDGTNLGLFKMAFEASRNFFGEYIHVKGMRWIPIVGNNDSTMFFEPQIVLRSEQKKGIDNRMVAEDLHSEDEDSQENEGD